MAEQNQNQQERTEEATPKKREEARKKGNVAKSMEVNSSAILLVAMIFFFLAGKYMLDGMIYYSKMIFENYSTVFIHADNVHGYLQIAALGFMKVILPFVGTIMLIGIAVNLLQVGPLFSFEPIKPKWSKISPLAGVKRVIFSRKALVELLKGIFKILLIGYVGYTSIMKEAVEFRPLMDKSAWQVFQFITTTAFSLGMKLVLILVVIAIIDFIFQKKDYLRNLRMTKQEVKDELKQTEGDPYVKARIRSIQREMARRRMMDDVPEADVIITNPTQIAIAIKYAPGEMESPKVIAKGRRKIAEKIKKIAEQHDIPIVEDKPLAWALFKTVNIGDFIPEDLFQAVAEILAYVYKLKDKKLAT